jgi:hypothetical protein
MGMNINNQPEGHGENGENVENVENGENQNLQNSCESSFSLFDPEFRMFVMCSSFKETMAEFHSIEAVRENLVRRLELITKSFSYLLNQDLIYFLSRHNNQFVRNVVNKINEFKGANDDDYSDYEKNKLSTLKLVCDRLLDVVNNM